MYEDELAFANELADRAGAIGLSDFRGSFEVHEKADRTPVTEADLAIEAAIREAVRERYPGDGVRIWANLIALEVDGEPVVGVANLPALGERYEAARGNGARLNGGPIRVSRADRVPRAFVLFAGMEDWRSGEYATGSRTWSRRPGGTVASETPGATAWSRGGQRT